MIEIAVQNLVKYYGATEVINGITLELKTGERIGIIGKNGCGKSTLFKIISGIETYDDGMLSLRKGINVGYLDQIPQFPEEYQVMDVLNTAFGELKDLKEQMNHLEINMAEAGMTAEDLDQLVGTYAQFQEKFEALGGYQIEEKVNRICSGLKFDEAFLNNYFEDLSGGEKTRVILGKLLLEDHDVLLLDEPTNHLDVSSIEWLEEYLESYVGSVMVISHDRFFLDKVITKIIEIENKTCSLYHGNYSYYVEEKERRILQQLEAYEQQKKKIKSMEEAIRRFRDWGTRSDDPRFFKKAANMQKRIDKMDHIERPKNDKKMKLSFDGGKRSGKDVITVRELSKSFDKLRLFEKADMDISYKDRVALLGANGCGKTTLLQLIMNAYQDQHGEELHGVKELNVEEGDIKIGASVKIGYHDQNIVFKDEKMTVVECLRDELPMPEGQARQILSRFLFYGDDVYKKVQNLSGGEKSRLKLCLLLNQDVNFLILDEPTNHLDMNSREVLEDALMNFKGTVLFVSHDRYFINKVAAKVMEVFDYAIKVFDGDYSYYKDEKKKNIQIPVKRVEQKVTSDNEKWRQGKKGVDKQNRIHSNKIKIIEDSIEELEEQIGELDKAAKENTNNYERLTEIHNKKVELNKILEDAYSEWEMFQ
ncbi:ribosomal protection-like ABC-F family protein [Vallitalea okinawensis]|uniref:ribosomal protection-like ABC-F family protein n=1 Tax=Vallitalea okinawensis TaxID=2078660 RepID=UPI0014794217|nr:ABC-F family ATP-binding cassette domain-containing protein [Vallitalea okinawensis]